MGVLAALTVSGCAELPTSGSIERGDQVRAAADDPAIRVLPRPPATGASPEEVVNGFLAASASFENDHAVARLYLTPEASARWDPSTGVTIVDDVPGYQLGRQANRVTMSARQVGRIGADGALTPVAGIPIQRSFELERSDGEWRIARSPQGLLLNRFDVDRAYRAFNTYFFNPDRTLLVPDPVYIPLEQAGSTTSLIRALLDGPTRWLRPAVDSTIPVGTSLVVDSVPVENGVAQVDVSTTFLEAADSERELAAAQVTMTLLQVPEVTGVTISVEGTPLQLPTAPAVMDAGTWETYDPDALVPALGPLFVRGGVVRRWSDQGGSEPVEAALGTGERPVRSPSQSWDGSVVTGLSADAGTLWVTTPYVSADVVRQLSGGRLLPASVDGDGDVWAVDVGSAKPRAFRSAGAGPWRVVSFPRIDGSLRGFRVSVDSTRVAVVVEDERGRGQLLIGRVVAARKSLRIEAFRPVELTLFDVADLSWAGADKLVVVGGSRATALEPTTVFVNGTVEPVAGTSLSSVDVITAAPGLPILAGTAETQIAEYVETGWRTVGRGRDPAYPG